MPGRRAARVTALPDMFVSVSYFANHPMRRLCIALLCKLKLRCLFSRLASLNKLRRTERVNPSYNDTTCARARCVGHDSNTEIVCSRTLARHVRRRAEKPPHRTPRARSGRHHRSRVPALAFTRSGGGCSRGARGRRAAAAGPHAAGDGPAADAELRPGSQRTDSGREAFRLRELERPATRDRGPYDTARPRAGNILHRRDGTLQAGKHKARTST